MIYHFLDFWISLESKRYPAKQGSSDEAECFHDRSHFRCCQYHALRADIEEINDVVVGSRAQIKEDGIGFQSLNERNYGADFIGTNICASRVVSCTADKLKITIAGSETECSGVDDIGIKEILEAVLGVADTQ